MPKSSGTVSGELKGLDYKDERAYTLEPGTYVYTLQASGEGRVAFKVYQEIGRKDKKDQRTKIEDKSKIQENTTLDGKFTVDKNEWPAGSGTPVEFVFSRAAASKKISYELSYKRSDERAG